MFHIVESDGCGGGAQRAAQGNTARIMAVEGAVMDVVGAVQACEQLQDKAGLVRGTSAAIKEVLIGARLVELPEDAIQREVPIDDTVVRIRWTCVERRVESAAPLQLTRRQRLQLGQR